MRDRQSRKVRDERPRPPFGTVLMICHVRLVQQLLREIHRASRGPRREQIDHFGRADDATTDLDTADHRSRFLGLDSAGNPDRQSVRELTTDAISLTEPLRADGLTPAGAWQPSMARRLLRGMPASLRFGN